MPVRPSSLLNCAKLGEILLLTYAQTARELAQKGGFHVHEAYLKLIDQRSVNWQNRARFFAIAAQAMPRILIDNARRRTATKRPKGERFIT